MLHVEKRLFVKYLSSFDQNTAISPWQCPFNLKLRTLVVMHGIGTSILNEIDCSIANFRKNFTIVTELRFQFLIEIQMKYCKMRLKRDKKTPDLLRLFFMVSVSFNVVWFTPISRCIDVWILVKNESHQTGQLVLYKKIYYSRMLKEPNFAPNLESRKCCTLFFWGRIFFYWSNFWRLKCTTQLCFSSLIGSFHIFTLI